MRLARFLLVLGSLVTHPARSQQPAAAVPQPNAGSRQVRRIMAPPKSARAQGQAARFENVYSEYKNAPEVTRERMYLETMEQILARSQKVIVDDPSGKGVIPYLPLPEIGKAGATP